MFSALGNAKLNYIVKAIYPHRSQGLLRKKLPEILPKSLICKLISLFSVSNSQLLSWRVKLIMAKSS